METKIVVAWSDEDQAFIAKHPDYESLATHGETKEAAEAEMVDLVQAIKKEVSPSL